MKTGVVTQASGSAYLELQNTKVICGVYAIFNVYLIDIKIGTDPDKRMNLVIKENYSVSLNILHLRVKKREKIMYRY